MVVADSARGENEHKKFRIKLLKGREYGWSGEGGAWDILRIRGIFWPQWLGDLRTRGEVGYLLSALAVQNLVPTRASRRRVGAVGITIKR